jgi:hypothetical protein
MTCVSSLSTLRIPPPPTIKKVAVEYIESWDDGEVAWDFVDEDTSVKDVTSSYLVYHPEETYDFIDKMDDGEVPWGPPLKTKKKELSDPPLLPLLINELYEKIVSKEDIIGEFIDWDKVDLQEEFVILLAAAFVAFSHSNFPQNTPLQGGPKKSHPLTMTLLVFALVFTKNVHSAS